VTLPGAEGRKVVCFVGKMVTVRGAGELALASIEIEVVAGVDGCLMPLPPAGGISPEVNTLFFS